MTQSELGNLSPEDNELLVSLPYRVGVWMSYTDDEEGEQDDIQEMKVLEAIIRSIAQLHERSEFVQQVARETLRRRDDWPRWSQGCFDILPECEQAIGFLKSYVNDNDLRDYKATLVEIATVVAQAYGEFGEFDDKEEEGLGTMIGKFVGKFSGLSSKDADHPMNISATEDTALSRLIAVLKDD